MKEQKERFVKVSVPQEVVERAKDKTNVKAAGPALRAYLVGSLIKKSRRRDGE